MSEGLAVNIEEIIDDDAAIQTALDRAFRNAVLEHRRDGVPMVFWENGKIVHVPADQVSLPEVEE
jgi:hypothetical protein